MNVDFLSLLLLIIIANGAPVLTHWLLNDSFNLAVDFNQKLPDKNQLFGSSKTWRGILAALLATTAAAWLLNYPAQSGLLVAIYAMLGDLCSSFIKRRLSIPPSSMAPLLDQVPESLLPALMMMHTFNLTLSSVIELAFTFVIIELVLSFILYKWGLRKRPY